ncbi:hypothetical protein H9M94_00265 [Mycoplasma sp. Pen4]|uniref:hypothetical protein n=1 Tax=Mycoplasma sp. Pen4 TaxID=640330 RepID=UPI0016541912|nr:hypothetical protein [Mycoplasma sp. Pen4]QNM93699.1 hypothetical protein H9M94_00265 [Mycoplasma sp. Pen4]
MKIKKTNSIRIEVRQNKRYVVLVGLVPNKISTQVFCEPENLNEERLEKFILKHKKAIKQVQILPYTIVYVKNYLIQEAKKDGLIPDIL